MSSDPVNDENETTSSDEVGASTEDVVAANAAAEDHGDDSDQAAPEKHADLPDDAPIDGAATGLAPAPDDSETADHDVGEEVDPDALTMDWYILKVAFNREDSIRESLLKRIRMEGLDEFFGEVVIPTEDVKTFTRGGKPRTVKKKLLPGYIMVYMAITEDTWFLVRETSGISDFTGSEGKPMPMDPEDVDKFINRPTEEDEDGEGPKVKIGIPFKRNDTVRVKEGNFENQEGSVESIDEASGRVTIEITIFGR
ncbi:MAG: transcription termination/antitermination NusG family protein, partial [Planctomycetota bacterium]